MTAAPTTFVCLLRAVNVGGRKVEMAALKEVAAKAGLKDARTYIASGNLVVSGTGSAKAVQAKLEKAIAARFGIEVPVIVRTAEQWQAYLGGNPFRSSPGNLHYLFLSQEPHAPGVAAALQARAQAGERVKVVGDALWIDFPEGMGRSKVTPAAVDKATGSPTTARNWNTVRKLAEMAGGPAP